MKKTKRIPSKPTSNVAFRDGKIGFRKKPGPGILVEILEISDSDWAKIVTLAPPLVPNARRDIGMAIWSYRNKAFAERASLATKRRVIRMRGAIRKLLKDADGLLEDQTFFAADLPYWKSRTGPDPHDIKTRVQRIEELDQILADAQDRLQMKRGRKSSAHLKTLIEFLGSIQADLNGQFVKRSTKKGSLIAINPFITFCVKLADPKIKDGAINDVLAKCIAEHHETLLGFGFNTATGECVEEP